MSFRGGCHVTKLSCDFVWNGALAGETDKRREWRQFLRFIWDCTYSLVHKILTFSDSDFPFSGTASIVSASSRTCASTAVTSTSLCSVNTSSSESILTVSNLFWASLVIFSASLAAFYIFSLASWPAYDTLTVATSALAQARMMPMSCCS